MHRYDCFADKNFSHLLALLFSELTLSGGGRVEGKRARILRRVHPRDSLDRNAEEAPGQLNEEEGGEGIKSLGIQAIRL